MARAAIAPYLVPLPPPQLSWPQSATTTGFEHLPDWEPTASIFFTTSMPSVTLPNTTCFPSSHAVFTVHKKNCEPLVFGPAFAIERMPGPVCLRVKFSSANFAPYIDSPPVPLPAVKSPPWHMNSVITRWNALPLKCNGLPLLPVPFSPVQRQRKFSAVLGATSALSSITMRPDAAPPIVMSKKTFGFDIDGFESVNLVSNQGVLI